MTTDRPPWVGLNVPGPRPEAACRPDATIMARVRSACPTRSATSMLAEAFHRHLFALLPHARGRFATDLETQRDRMGAVLLDAVRTLEAMAVLEERLHRLGVEYSSVRGLGPGHFPTVGQALVRAARELAPAGEDRALGSAWAAVANWITTQMTHGAAEAAPTPARPVLRGVVRVPPWPPNRRSR